MQNFKSEMQASSRSCAADRSGTASHLLFALALGAAWLLTAEARAEESIGAETSAESRDGDEHSIVGLMLDAGAPDGAAASLVIRPWYWLRLHGGITNNLVSNGLRGGLSLVPFDTWITISLNAEVGHYVEGDANVVLQMLGQKEDVGLLRRFGYDYANGHVGLELGGETLVLYVHAGFTAIRATFAEDTQELSDSSTVRFTKGPSVKGFVPSAKAGLILYLF